MEKPDSLSGFHPWPKGEPYPSWKQQGRLARKNWYVRLAEKHGMVPHHRLARIGVPELMALLQPEAFRDADEARSYANRRFPSIIQKHWGDDKFSWTSSYLATATGSGLSSMRVPNPQRSSACGQPCRKAQQYEVSDDTDKQ